MSLRSASTLAFVGAAVVGVAALFFNSRAWGPGCAPHLTSARPVAQALAIAALVLLLAVPVLCIAGLIVTRLRRGRRDGTWAVLNVTLFVLWWPVAYNAWVLLGTIAGGGCDSS